MYMKKSLIAFATVVLCNLHFSAIGQTSFSWLPNDTITTNLDPSSYTELKIEQVNLSGDTLNLGIEVVYNDLPNTWDGMVCIYGICLGTIPSVGSTSSMNPIYGTTNGYVRLTVNPQGGTQQATLRIRVYDIDNPTDGDTATWVLNSQPLSIEDYASQISFNVYPNPAQDYLIMEADVTIDAVQILSISGQKVIDFDLEENSSQKINISSLKKGTYILQYTDNGITRGSRKILIE